jgi:hypothetical protein
VTTATSKRFRAGYAFEARLPRASSARPHLDDHHRIALARHDVDLEAPESHVGADDDEAPLDQVRRDRRFGRAARAQGSSLGVETYWPL